MPMERQGSYGSLIQLWSRTRTTKEQKSSSSLTSAPPSITSSTTTQDLEAVEEDDDLHERCCSTPLLRNNNPHTPSPKVLTYHNTNNNQFPIHTIRFQVVIWYIGPVDVVLGLVTMKFRVTIFWNIPTEAEHEAMAHNGYGIYDAKNKNVWAMHGRQRAYERELTEIRREANLVYVPPVSILNAVDYDTMGEPEVCMVNAEMGKMKWTCMYKASLIQENMTVSDFPHDEHELMIKLGILKHRHEGRRWDKRRWTLGLATEDDNQCTTRVAHGLVVDHVKIPEFHYDADALNFDLVPLDYGCVGGSSDVDHCLQVSLKVRRDSGYYDNNITPLLAMLNVVSISALSLNQHDFGDRGQMIVATAFVEIGIRMTVDCKLPYVGYQIKMQRVLNNFFFTLLFLTLESSLVYSMVEIHKCPHSYADLVDWISAVAALLYTVVLLVIYFGYKDYLPSLTNARQRAKDNAER